MNKEAEPELVKEEPQSLGRGRTLRFKGLIFTAFLVAYSVFVAVYVMHEKNALLRQFEEYRQIKEAEAVLVEANLALFDAYGKLFLITETVDRKTVVGMVHEEFIVLNEKLNSLKELYPARAETFKGLLKYFADAVTEPSAAKLGTLKEALALNKAELDNLLLLNRELQEERFAEYHRRSDTVAITALLLGLLGLAFLGVGSSIFFRRMAGDIRTLQSRVVEIMHGYRGSALPVSREDELGSLIEGVNQMARELGSREQELEMERQGRSHREQKGSLAHFSAGLVHEIGNPVTAIAGLNQELLDNDQLDPAEREEFRQQIQEYSRRLISITEDLTQIAAPLESDAQLLNLNGIIRDVAGLLRYDERWYGISIDLDLDPNLPAFLAKGDQINQILMNGLTNAYDALQDIKDRSPAISIVTQQEGEAGILLSIEDNGCGMDEQQVSRCFESFYTTKDRKQFAGLGLLLCRSVVESLGGTIGIQSVANEGTKLNISFSGNSAA